MNLPTTLDPTIYGLQIEAALRARAWNAVVPRRAVEVHDGGDHVKVLHATKGWRFIHKRRLGLSPEDRV